MFGYISDEDERDAHSDLSCADYSDEGSDSDSDCDESSEQYRWRQADRYNQRQESIAFDLIDAIENDNRALADKLARQLDSARISEFRSQIISAIINADAGSILSDFQSLLGLGPKSICALIKRAIREQKPNLLSALFSMADFKLQADMVRVLADVDDPEQLLILVQVPEFYNNPDLADKLKDKLESNFELEADHEVSILLNKILWEQYLAEFKNHEKFRIEIEKLRKLIDFKNPVLTCNRIITSLLYEAKRHPCLSFDCQIRLKLLKLFDTQRLFTGYKKKQFEDYIKQQEAENNVYFNVAASDDSDSDDDRKLAVNRRKAILLQRADATAVKAERDKTVKKLPKTNAVNFNNDLRACTEVKYRLPERAHLEKSDDRQVLQDLQTLNQEFAAAAANNTIPELLSRLQTNFVVMQARGITYTTTKFNQAQRQEHRNRNEINQAVYATDVLATADVKNPADLAKTADILKQALIKLRQPPAVACNNKKYASAADAIQESYTTDYHGYRETLSLFSLPCVANPFVSTSDRCYHALRYAYGDKPYDGYENELLQPCWSNGQAQQNKSGKVYLSIHPLTDYGSDGPFSVTDMVWNGRIKVNNIIIAERETTFPALLESDRVKLQHIAKYPSFHKEYKDIYKIKYGFDKELYDLFRHAIKDTALHSEEHKNAKKLLTSWLCAYHEVRLLEEAQEYARQNNSVLIYRLPNNQFGFELFADSPARHSNQVTPEKKQEVNNKRQQINASPIDNEARNIIKAEQESLQMFGLFQRWTLNDGTEQKQQTQIARQLNF